MIDIAIQMGNASIVNFYENVLCIFNYYLIWIDALYIVKNFLYQILQEIRNPTVDFSIPINIDMIKF